MDERMDERVDGENTIKKPGRTGRTGLSATIKAPFERMQARFGLTADRQPAAKPAQPPPPASAPKRSAMRPDTDDRPMQFGDVCRGWTRHAWVIELRRKADRCDRYRPDMAAHYRAWADGLESKTSDVTEGLG